MPEQETVVILVLTLINKNTKQTADTKEIKVIVPAKIQEIISTTSITPTTSTTPTTPTTSTTPTTPITPTTPTTPTTSTTPTTTPVIQTISKKINNNNNNFYSKKLIKTKSDSVVYFIKDDKKRAISPDVFKKNGYKIKDVIKVDEKIIKSIALGKEILYKDGTLLKAINNKQLYFIQDEKVRPIPNLKICKAYAFKWKDVILVSSKMIKKYQMGKPLLFPSHPNGTFLKTKNSAKVYLVQNGRLRHISSLKAFKKLKVKASKIKQVNQKILDGYLKGEIIK